jgi:hypothetical protein
VPPYDPVRRSREQAGVTLKRWITLCYREVMSKWLAALALTFAFATVVPAQLMRMLPAGGKLGELVVLEQGSPLVQIGNEVLRLAPGVIIRDQNNRTIVYGALPQSASVLYLQDPAGAITRMYILLPDELERIRRARDER